MQLLNDIHHLTFITADMDRLISFYERIFGARVTVDIEEEGLRHAFIEVGPHTVLHPFQIPGLSLQASSRCSSAGASTTLRSMPQARRRSGKCGGALRRGRKRRSRHGQGSLLLLSFIDPDGGSHEVVSVKPGVPVTRGLKRAEWTKVQLD